MATRTKKKQKLTQEIMDKLHGISVVSGTIEFKIKLEDVPEEYLPIFTIRNFNATDTGKIRELAEKVDESKDNSEDLNTFMDELTRQHIVGWTNLYDLSTGEEFEFEVADDGGCNEVKYAFLPSGLKVKVLQFIYELTGVMS